MLKEKEIQLNDIKNDEINKYIISIVCFECSTEIIKSKEMTGKELDNAWSKLVITAPLNTPECPNCKYSTWSDCNIHADFKIRKV